MIIKEQPGLNVPLLTKVLDHITEHPDEWRQSWWATKTECGTACCVAGWATVFSGHELSFSPHHADEMWASYTADGEMIEDVAKRELGLDDEAAEALFQASNSRSALWYFAEQMSGGHIVKPEPAVP